MVPSARTFGGPSTILEPKPLYKKPAVVSYQEKISFIGYKVHKCNCVYPAEKTKDPLNYTRAQKTDSNFILPSKKLDGKKLPKKLHSEKITAKNENLRDLTIFISKVVALNL